MAIKYFFLYLADICDKLLPLLQGISFLLIIPILFTALIGEKGWMILLIMCLLASLLLYIIIPDPSLIRNLVMGT